VDAVTATAMLGMAFWLATDLVARLWAPFGCAWSALGAQLSPSQIPV